MSRFMPPTGRREGICAQVQAGLSSLKDPKDHINARIAHSGSKDQYERDTRKHVL